MNIVTLNNRQMKLLEVLLQAKHPLSLRAAAEKCHLTICDKTLRADFLRIQEFSKGYVTIEPEKEEESAALEEQMRARWHDDLLRYRTMRLGYLLYPDGPASEL